MTSAGVLSDPVPLSLAQVNGEDDNLVDPAHVRTFVADTITAAARPPQDPASAATAPGPGPHPGRGDRRCAQRRRHARAGRRGATPGRFTAGGTANASAATSSAVHYRPGAQAAAGAAARTLGAGVLVTADAAVPARHVRVVLGTTYAPPLPAGPAPAAAAGPTGPPVTAGGVPCVD